MACSQNRVEKLAILQSLEGYHLAPPYLYWAEFDGAHGSIRRLHLQSKITETLYQTQHQPQQITAHKDGLLFFQSSTSYEAPNQILFFDRAVTPLTIEFIAKAPQMTANSEGAYFINRGRYLNRVGASLQIESLVKLSGSPLQLQASDSMLYVLQREFSGVTYSHNALLSVDPTTKEVKNLLAPEYSPQAFALQKSLVATAKHSDGSYALLDVRSREVLHQTKQPLSLLTANSSFVFFMVERATDQFEINVFSRADQKVSWFAGPFSERPSALFADGDFVYWIINDDNQKALFRASNK
jgi:hypothetical protein